MQMMCYWGHKFEQYVSCPLSKDEIDTSVPVDSRRQYCQVFTSRLDKFNLCQYY